MATFTKLTRSELEELARTRYREAFPEGRPRANPPRNIGSVLIITGADRVEIPYRGRMYELLPVSFEDGLRLTQCQSVIEELVGGRRPTHEDSEAYAGALRVIVRMTRRYLLPRGRLRRLRWRLRLVRNPFRHATEAELGELLGFFLGCRMRSRVRYPAT